MFRPTMSLGANLYSNTGTPSLGGALAGAVGTRRKRRTNYVTDPSLPAQSVGQAGFQMDLSKGGSGYGSSNMQSGYGQPSLGLVGKDQNAPVNPMQGAIKRLRVQSKGMF